MTITLKPEQEAFVRQQLQSGKYRTIDDVIVKAFQLLAERDREYLHWVEETRAKVELGIEQLDRGEGIDGAEVIARLRDRLHKASQQNNQ
ncbi:MAG: type II toxin-antitoxin system ParD family antitoxin [Hormoscilla sp. GM7CHS1pb]|nr:type II toxin-antitoxin system ParD family antitoxin [Hormoscilla sp. GM7CHS1pb]